MRDGKIVRAQGYGLANVELNVPVRPETIFQSGSMGKQFTATAIMMLVEEGKIGLEDKITKYFPDSPSTWNDITIRRLLTHTSGIKNYTEGEINYRLDYSEDELLKKAQSFPLDFPPGDKWNYSNTGYLVLGVLIHKVTGKFYGDFLQERIFRPLGMTTTRIMSEADIIPNRSSGYRLVKGELKNQEYVSPTLNTTADGSLYFTVLDLAKWDAALYTEKLLKRSSLEQMWTPVKLNNGKTYDYGFGWSLDQIHGHKIIEHGGAWQGIHHAHQPLRRRQIDSGGVDESGLVALPRRRHRARSRRYLRGRLETAATAQSDRRQRTGGDPALPRSDQWFGEWRREPRNVDPRGGEEIFARRRQRLPRLLRRPRRGQDRGVN